MIVAPPRDTPYAHEKRRSVAARMDRGGIRPKGLGGLLAWFLGEWSAEVPDRSHTRGVFFGRPEDVQFRSLGGSHSTHDDLVGGSLIGTPASAEPARRYIEERPTQRDVDGNYQRPMHAALALMAGRNPRSDGAWMAKYLGAIAASAGDWRGVAYRVGFPPQAAETYTMSALHRLWDLYRPAPIPLEDMR